MKKIILLVLAIFLLINIKIVFAKSYSYSYIKMFLDLEKNGSVFVTQERAYDFRGSFSWAFMDLKKKGASDIDFIQIRDLDTGEILDYDLEEDWSHIKATWHYNAYNEIKKFFIVYEIKEGVQRYRDVGEFYWKLIEDEHVHIENFNAEVNLPEPSSDLFKLFVHSAAEPGTMEFSNDLKRVTVNMRDIPKDQFIEFRLLTSSSIFSDTEMLEDYRYETILNEEKINLAQSSVLGLVNSILFYPLLISPLVILFLYFYFKYGVEPKVDYEGIYEHEPPMKIPPMALTNLIKGRFNENRFQVRSFIATIFDLARRGYLIIKEEVKPHFIFFEKKEQIFILTPKGKKELNSAKPKLLDFELYVLKFLFRIVPVEGIIDVKNSILRPDKEPKIRIWTKKTFLKVTSSDIIKWNRGRTTGLHFINALHKKALSWFESEHFKIHTKLSMKKRNLFLTISLVYIGFVSIFLVIIERGLFPFILILGIILGLFLIFASIPILRRTPESTLALKKWKAFKKFISDFSAMKDAPISLIHIWDEYLIYAVVLGVAKELLKILKRLSEEQNMTFASARWYYGSGVSKVPSGTMSPEAFSSMVSNLSNTINALSSSTSVGGGFSGGGGGGGGGGSSGAG